MVGLNFDEYSGGWQSGSARSCSLTEPDPTDTFKNYLMVVRLGLNSYKFNVNMDSPLTCLANIPPDWNTL